MEFIRVLIVSFQIFSLVQINQKHLFLLNNLKQSSKNRIRLMEYFISKFNHNRVLFLREIHFTCKNESAWVSDFTWPVFSDQGACNLCSVLMTYLAKRSFFLNEQKTDEAERILILDITPDVVDQDILVNLYNANMEIYKVKILEELQSLLKSLDSQNEHIIFAGDSSTFFNSQLEAEIGKPILKRIAFAKYVEIEENLNICNN